MFVQHHNLVYAACGSAGVLVYRLEGDNLQLDSSLSLKQLCSQELDTIYVRSVEIIHNRGTSYLIFGYDTLLGGGIAVAEISRTETRIKGALKTIPGTRIRKTSTWCNSPQCFTILAINDGVGVASYKLCFQRKKLRANPKIEEIVNYAKTKMDYPPIRIFEILKSPSASLITSVSQVTSIDSLVTLAQQNPEQFSTILASLPFLTKEQREQISSVVEITQTSEGNDILNLVREQLGNDIVEKILANPDMFRQFTGDKLDVDSLAELETSLANRDIFSLVQSQNVTDNDFTQEDVKNIDVSLQDLYNNSKSLIALTEGTEKIDLKKIHNKQDNPFAKERVKKNAALEIQKTIQSLGDQFFSTKDNTIKEKMEQLNPEELHTFFAMVLNQAAQDPHIMSLLISTGVDVKQVYMLWRDKDYQEIIDQLEVEILAELFRALPSYGDETTFDCEEVILEVPSIRDMDMDKHFLYIAAGSEGVYVAHRKTGKILDTKKYIFSDITSFIPYKVYGKRYYVMTDSLNGIVLYKRTMWNKIGEYVNRLSLVGETAHVYPFENLLWVADGSNGVLSVLFHRNTSMTIESEQYEKQGIVQFISSARRKQVLASFGPGGLAKLRVTKKNEKKTGDSSTSQKKDLVDLSMEWGLTSPIAAFLKRLIFLD